MTKIRTRLSLPPIVQKGEVFEVKTLVTHPMDNGFMFSRDGQRIPRHIIHRFEASFNGALVFRADWHEAVSPNPFMSFHASVQESGKFDFRWYDDDGTIHTASAEIEVA